MGHGLRAALGRENRRASAWTVRNTTQGAGSRRGDGGPEWTVDGRLSLVPALVQDRQQGLIPHHPRPAAASPRHTPTVPLLQRGHVEAGCLGVGGERPRLHEQRRCEPVGLAAYVPDGRGAGMQSAERLADDLVGLVLHRAPLGNGNPTVSKIWLVQEWLFSQVLHLLLVKLYFSVRH